MLIASVDRCLNRKAVDCMRRRGNQPCPATYSSAAMRSSLVRTLQGQKVAGSVDQIDDS